MDVNISLYGKNIFSFPPSFLPVNFYQFPPIIGQPSNQPDIGMIVKKFAFVARASPVQAEIKS